MIRFKNKFFTNFLLKLLAFFVLIFVLDRVIGNSLKKIFFKQSSGYDFQTTYAINEAKADILIFGSSRAVNIYDPEILTQRMNASCFNVGRNGEPIFYHAAILKTILKRDTPKIVILSFDARSFSKGREPYDRIAALLPYYKEHPEIHPIVMLKGPFEKLKLLSNIYPYNSLLLPSILGNTNRNKVKYPFTDGFVPLKKIFNGPLETFDYSKEKSLDSVKINTYKIFIRDCVRSGVRLYIFCPPYMINAVGTDLSIITAKKIAKENNINFFDYSRDSFFINKQPLFADFRHLNESGVQVFSNKVADHILKEQQAGTIISQK